MAMFQTSKIQRTVTCANCALMTLTASAVLSSAVLAQNYAEPPSAPMAAQNPADKGYSCTTSDRATQTIRLCSPLIANPESGDNVRITALLKRAKAWVVEEEPWAGINDYGQVIELNPIHIDAFSERAKLYVKLGEYALAKQDFSAIIKIDGTDPTTYCHRGLAKLNLKEFSSALDDYNRALELAPGRIDCIVERGDVYAEMGEYKKALQEYDAALAADERYKDAYMRRGRLHKTQGEKQLAIADYSKVLELNYFDLKAMRELQSLGKFTPWKHEQN